MLQHSEWQKVKVRADHLYNGEIIPLGYIDPNGKTIRIDRVISSKMDGNYGNLSNISFYCRTVKSIIILTYTNSGWFLS